MVALSSGVIPSLQAANFNAVSVAALLGYEIAITLDQEIDYIWRSRWTPVKLLYLVIRYYVAFFSLVNSIVVTSTGWSLLFCRIYENFQLWSLCITLPLVDVIVALRIYALYGQSKKMGFALALLVIGETMMGFGLLGLSTAAIDSKPMKNDLPITLPGCLIPTFSSKFRTIILSFWGVFSAFQAAYVAITLFKFFLYFRDFGYSRLAVAPLLNVFFRDGALYFVIILAVVLVNTLIEELDSSTSGLGVAAAYWIPAIPSIMICRLMLNIRHITAPSTVRIGSQESATELNDIRFMSGPSETVSGKQYSAW